MHLYKTHVKSCQIRLDLIFQSAKVLLQVLRLCVFFSQKNTMFGMFRQYALPLFWSRLMVELVVCLPPAGEMKIVVAVAWLKSGPMAGLFDV